MAYELAFLDADCQEVILKNISDYKISDKVVKAIRHVIIGKNFHDKEEKISFVESQLAKLCVTVTQSYKLDIKGFREYIPDAITNEHAAEYIIEALKFYRKNK